jgi:D-tyrosyl-tRNA(Tyr) deacylase
MKCEENTTSIKVCTSFHGCTYTHGDGGQMKALIQRVSEATVTVEGKIVGSIGKGLCVFVGVTHSDTQRIVEKIADKILHLRIFEDDGSKMNLSTLDIQSEILIVSQFTLYGDTRKGRRPSWIASAPAEVAEPLIDDLIEALRVAGIKVETGLFRQSMDVQLTNEGPATLQIEVD